MFGVILPLICLLVGFYLCRRYYRNIRDYFGNKYNSEVDNEGGRSQHYEMKSQTSSGSSGSKSTGDEESRSSLDEPDSKLGKLEWDVERVTDWDARIKSYSTL